MDRRAFLLGAPALLAACSTKPVVYADTAAVQASIYPNTGPTSLEVFTSFNVGSDGGAHTALFINGAQRVVFDPAGTFAHPSLPERHDVIYGISPAVQRVFVDYHTRVTFWTTLQSFAVSPGTAEYVMRAVEAAGPVSDAMCTRTTTNILASAPGMPFKVDVTWFPNNLHDDLLTKPGVTRQEFRQSDDADKEQFWANNTL